MGGILDILQGISGAFARVDHDKSCKIPMPPSTKRDSKVRKVDPIGGLTNDGKTCSSTEPLKKNVTTPDLKIGSSMLGRHVLNRHAPSTVVPKVVTE